QVVSRRIVNRPDGCGRPVVVHGDVETGDKISAVAQCRGLVPLVALGYRHPAAVHIPATATAAMQRLSPVLLIEFLPCMGAQSCSTTLGCRRKLPYRTKTLVRTCPSDCGKTPISPCRVAYHPTPSR